MRILLFKYVFKVQRKIRRGNEERGAVNRKGRKNESEDLGIEGIETKAASGKL